jgi:hypothetical protein
MQSSLQAKAHAIRPGLLRKIDGFDSSGASTLVADSGSVPYCTPWEWSADHGRYYHYIVSADHEVLETKWYSEYPEDGQYKNKLAAPVLDYRPVTSTLSSRNSKCTLM